MSMYRRGREEMEQLSMIMDDIEYEYNLIESYEHRPYYCCFGDGLYNNYFSSDYFSGGNRRACGYGGGLGFGDGEVLFDDNGLRFGKSCKAVFGSFLFYTNILNQYKNTESYIYAFCNSGIDGLPINGGNLDTVCYEGAIHTVDGPMEICTETALHATFNPLRWKYEAIWLCKMYYPLIYSDHSKICSQKREIVKRLI